MTLAFSTRASGPGRGASRAQPMPGSPPRRSSRFQHRRGSRLLIVTVDNGLDCVVTLHGKVPSAAAKTAA